jgi:hypothetical protein
VKRATAITIYGSLAGAPSRSVKATNQKRKRNCGGNGYHYFRTGAEPHKEHAEGEAHHNQGDDSNFTR